jgi:hypothetical protein
LLAIEAAAVALNVAVVAPAATVADAGAVSEGLLLASATLAPPVGAVWVSATVQLLVAPALNAVGKQVTDRRDGAVIVPPPADVILKAFPLGSTPIEFAT